jgi:hypothetical protein
MALVGLDKTAIGKLLKSFLGYLDSDFILQFLPESRHPSCGSGIDRQSRPSEATAPSLISGS